MRISLTLLSVLYVSIFSEALEVHTSRLYEKMVSAFINRQTNCSQLHKPSRSPLILLHDHCSLYGVVNN